MRVIATATFSQSYLPCPIISLQLLEHIDYSDKINLPYSLAGRELLFKLLLHFNYTDHSFHKLIKGINGKLSFIHLPIHFSISHSHDFVVCIADTENVIGVDVEQIRKFDLKLIERICTLKQRKYVLNASDPYRAFIELWTAKEAIYKCEGTAGFSKFRRPEGVKRIFRHAESYWFVDTWYIDPLNVCSTASTEEDEIRILDGTRIYKNILPGN